MVECPSISETIFGFRLRVRSSVAHVCRRSWKRISGSPARFRSGLNERRVRLWRLRVEGLARLGGEYEAVLVPQRADPIYLS
jgi:hypothetical protein